MLNAAWNDGITGRRSAATRSTAALFMATLIAPYAAPKTSSTRPRARAERVSGGRATPTQTSTAEPDGDPVRAEAGAQPAGEHHGGHRAGGDSEQGQAEGARRRSGLCLDGGDADDPAGEEEAVQGEEDGQGGAEADQGALRRRVVGRSERRPANRSAEAEGGPQFVYGRHKARIEG